ncbi:MAG TPA: transposase [Terracidiphilus sp.]|nr:transposase [Terracidiphilus sp.]
MAVRYLAAACWVSKQAFESKELNSNRLSRAFYAVVREKFGIPSQLTCSLFRQVTASYKTLKALGKWDLCIYQRLTMPLTLNRDFSRNKKGVTILGKPVTLQHPNIPANGWKDSKVKRVGKTWYLCLAHEVDIAEPKTEGCIVGVDFGIKRLMVATNSANARTFFFKGGMENHRRSCIRRERAAIQSVGTRGSRRLLRRMSGHEAAVTVNLLHRASKQLVAYAVANGARTICLEDLANIRDASLSKGKDLRSKVHRWPYAQGQFFVSYKAAAVGIGVEFVNPRNTSRGCPECGFVLASNRKGLQFCCQKCQHRDDADRVGSRNIRLRSVLTAQCVASTESLQASKSSELPISHLECSVTRHAGCGVGSGSIPAPLGRGT